MTIDSSSAPPAPSTPGETQSTEASAVTRARQLVRDGHHVELQGTVVHSSGARTVSVYAAMAALCGLLGLLFPALSIIGLLAICGSALIDLDGGRGWVRRLILCDIGHNIIVWPTTRTDRPVLIIAAPLESDVRLTETPRGLLLVPLGLAMAAGVGVVLAVQVPTLGIPLVVATASGLVIVSLVSALSRFGRRRDVPDNPAAAVLCRVLQTLSAAPPDGIDLVYCLMEGGTTHHDGMEIVLRNNRHRMEVERSRVLALQPRRGPVSFLDYEGRVRLRKADIALRNAASQAGLPLQTGNSAALAAARIGYRSGGITVGPDGVELGTVEVVEIIRVLARAARDDRW